MREMESALHGYGPYTGWHGLGGVVGTPIRYGLKMGKLSSYKT